MAEATAPIRASFSLARLIEPGLGSAALLACGVAVVAAGKVSTPIESDYGLVASMPFAFWCAVGALTAIMVVALNRDPVPGRLLGFLQVCLCIAVYAAPSLVTDIPRTEVAWRHLGVTDALTSSARVDSDIDAYFSWPGFFAGLGAVLDISGLDPQTVALWAPLANGLLWIVAVALVLRALTDDKRHQWLGMWVFTLTNWIDQDYLSPQATAFFLYLVVLALMLTMLSARPTTSLGAALREDGVGKGVLSWWSSREPCEASRRLRLGAMFLVVLLSMVIIASHQLTPFVLIGAVLLLTLAGRSWAPGLVVVIGLGLVLWLTSGASSYLTGHPVLGLDDVGTSAAANVSDRLHGSPGHMMVVHVRTVYTACWWLLAAIGIVRLARGRALDRRSLLLFLVPFLLVPANSYGGEMMLRAALFASPFTAYFAAGALLPHRRRHSATGVVILAALLTVASVAMFTARYGNARFDMFTQHELDGSEALYDLTPPGTVLIAAAHPTPWRFTDYQDFRHLTLTDLCPGDQPLTRCVPEIRSRADRGQAGAMLLVNRSHLASMDMQAKHSAEEMVALEALLRRSGDTTVVYRNPDVVIYAIRPSEER